MYCKINKYTFNFQNIRTISTFDIDIYNGKITAKEADEDQCDLLVDILNFQKKVKPKNPEKKYWKEDVLKKLHNRFESRERILTFPIKTEGVGFLDHSNLKLLTPKQMLQKLSIALA